MFEFFKKKKPVEESGHNIVSLSANDAVLQTYQEKAQDEIQYLIDFMNNNERDEELFRYAIKTNFREGDNSEHMWVQVYDFEDDYFFGQLANEPETIELLKYGDDVRVFRKDVEDWILEDFLTNTKVGNFASIYIKSNANRIKG